MNILQCTLSGKHLILLKTLATRLASVRELIRVPAKPGQMHRWATPSSWWCEPGSAPPPHRAGVRNAKRSCTKHDKEKSLSLISPVDDGGGSPCGFQRYRAVIRKSRVKSHQPFALLKTSLLQLLHFACWRRRSHRPVLRFGSNSY